MLNLGIACINKNHLLSALSRPDLKKYFVKSMTLPNEIQNDVVAAHKFGQKKPRRSGVLYRTLERLALQQRQNLLWNLVRFRQY